MRVFRGGRGVVGYEGHDAEDKMIERLENKARRRSDSNLRTSDMQLRALTSRSARPYIFTVYEKFNVLKD